MKFCPRWSEHAALVGVDSNPFSSSITVTNSNLVTRTPGKHKACIIPSTFTSTLHLLISQRRTLSCFVLLFFVPSISFFQLVFAVKTICKQSKYSLYLLQTILPNYWFQGQSRSGFSLQMQKEAWSVSSLIAEGRRTDSRVRPLPDKHLLLQTHTHTLAHYRGWHTHRRRLMCKLYI